MERAKTFMIFCWLLLLVAMLVVVYLSQPLSDHFAGNDYLIVSVLIYIPLFVLATLALRKLRGGKGN